MRIAALMIGLATLAPASGRAQCVLEGDAIARDVRPSGTRLALHVREAARVTFGARRARVEGVRPIAFEGETDNGAVEVTVARPTRAHGVIELAPGTRLRVERSAGHTLRAQLASAVIDVPAVWLGCDAIALAGDALAGDARVADAPRQPPREIVRARRRALSVFESPSARRGVGVRAHGESTALEELEVLGVEGTRVHVRTPIGDGLVLDGWADARDVEAPPEDLRASGSGCGCDASRDDCGHGYAGTRTFEGVATIRAGTELREGRVSWGRVVEDVRATVVVVRWRDRDEETVFVRSVPGVSVPGCGDLARIDRAAVVLDDS